MDQRRVVAFLALSFVVLIINGMLNAPPQPKDVPAAVEQPGGGKEAQVEPAVVAPAEDNKSPAIDVAEVPPQPAVIEPVESAPLEYITLGSVDQASPYRLLVTLTSEGAGVRRIELSSSHFRDLQDRGGYLGQLELAAAAEGGLRVQAVGAGTPAALAGVEVGDRILALTYGDQTYEVHAAEEYSKVLADSQPGDKLTLHAVRGTAEQKLEVELQRRPLEVIRPEIENYEARSDEAPPKNFASPPSFRFTLNRLGEAGLDELEKQTVETEVAAAEREEREVSDLAEKELPGVELFNANWEITERNETSVTFRQTLPAEGIEVLKRYRLEPIPAQDQADKDYPAYSLELDLEIRNLGAAETRLAYRLDGPNGLPLEGWWYGQKIGHVTSSAGLRDVLARYRGNDIAELTATAISTDDADLLQNTEPLAFIGVDAQYFSVIMLPEHDAAADWIDEARGVRLSPKPRSRSSEGRFANVTCRLISNEFHLPAAGEPLKHSYRIFAGPKRPDLLEKYHPQVTPEKSLADLVTYGWFSSVSRAMLGILHFFYGIVGNYGISIILLTVLVRSCMYPISRKQAQSMAKMQEMKPEMDKIKEKYKGDSQKQSQAMQELYRKHNINPLAGCLPMFIQLPIFLGLYRALMVDVELRQAPLISESIHWCSNLAAPDMLVNWSSVMPDFITDGQGIFGLGPYLNVLPLVTIGLFIAQQKMFMPPPANEQAALQQKIMQYMMIFFGIMFFKVASGLCLYFIASSIWGIAERKLLPKPTPVDAAANSAIPAPKKTTPPRKAKKKR